MASIPASASLLTISAPPPPPPPLPPIPQAVVATILDISSSLDAPLLVAKAYQLGAVILLCVGLSFCIKAALLLYRDFSRLSTIIKYHTIVILHDISMCFNFIIMDVYHLWYGLSLQPGTWCQWSAYMAMVSVTSLYLSAAGVAYATYNLTERRPLSARNILLIHVACVATAALMTTLISGSSLGPYKGLYCAMEMSGQYAGTTLPFLVVFTGSTGLMLFWYSKSFQVFKESGHSDVISEASSMLLTEGVTLMAVSQAAYVFLFLNGIVTALGINVHYTIDIVAGWIVKLQPSINSMVLMHMMRHGVSFVKQAEDARKDGWRGPPPTPMTGGQHHHSLSSQKKQEQEEAAGLAPPPSLVFDASPISTLLSQKSRAVMDHALVRRLMDNVVALRLRSRANERWGGGNGGSSSHPKKKMAAPDLTGMTTISPVDGHGKSQSQFGGSFLDLFSSQPTHQKKATNGGTMVTDGAQDDVEGLLFLDKGGRRLDLLQQKQKAGGGRTHPSLSPFSPQGNDEYFSSYGAERPHAMNY